MDFEHLHGSSYRIFPVMDDEIREEKGRDETRSPRILVFVHTDSFVFPSGLAVQLPLLHLGCGFSDEFDSEIFAGYEICFNSELCMYRG